MFLFYSIWKPFGFEEAFNAFGKQKQDGYYKMQDMTPEICNAIIVPTEKSTATLIDSRDRNTYTVAKLPDNKCWMTQNLRIGSNSKRTTLISEDSDILLSSFTLEIGSLDNFYSGLESGYIYIDPDVKYGAYYSWFAATSGEGKNSTLTETSHSICPKNWKLPSQEEFQNLFSLYNNNAGGQLLESPPNFTLSGGLWEGSINKKGVHADFWSSSTSDSIASVAYTPRIYENDIDAVHMNNKAMGGAIRCVAR